MRMLRASRWIAVCALELLAAPSLAAQGGQQRLTFDGRPNMTQQEGEVELRKGPWVRTARFEADMQLTLPTASAPRLSLKGAKARTLEHGEVLFTAGQWQRIVMLVGARTGPFIRSSTGRR